MNITKYSANYLFLGLNFGRRLSVNFLITGNNISVVQNVHRNLNTLEDPVLIPHFPMDFQRNETNLFCQLLKR